MSNMITTPYRIRDMDRLALESLGFDTYDVAEHGKEIYLGCIPFESGYVQCWVRHYPARFWRFEFMNSAGEMYKMTTGSGYFNSYWDVVEKIMTNMVGIERVN